MKKIVSLLIALSLFFAMTSTAYATTVDESSSFNEFSSAVTTGNISGIDLNGEINTRATDYDVAKVESWADLDRNLLAKEWRGQGHCRLTSLELFDTVSWDITLHVQLWKDGHINTRADDTKKQTDTYTLSTKYVEGDSRDQFGVHVNCTVNDDYGTKIWDESDYVGYPFD